LARLVACLIPALLAASAPALRAEEPRVVVLGFDGADAALTAQWMDEGKLPNLARLRDQGTFSPLRSTIPSQTPVSWSTFSTGLNPGRHSIFDFLKRDVATYRPSFAAFDEGRVPFLYGERNPLVFGLAGLAALFVVVFLALKLFRVRTGRAVLAGLVLGAGAGGGLAWVAHRYLPVEVPQAINRQQGETFWETLGKAGKRVRVMRVPVTFPPEPFPHGELLSGLGVKPFYFTSELFFQPKGDNEVSVEIVELIDNKGEIPTEIKGPPNKLFPDGPDYVTIPMTLRVAEDRKSMEVEVSGTKLTMRPGEWSPWVRMAFPFNRLIQLHGIGRMRLMSLEPEIRLYLSPIQFDPSSLPPILQVTSPSGFAGTLVDRFGLFKTIGWMIDTWSIKAGTIDDETFFQDTDFTVDEDVEMLEGMLGDDDWDVYIHYFEFTDRVQHVMWRYTDPEHPLYTEEGNAAHGGVILEAYQRMDEIVGRVLDHLPANTDLYVVSDHGFAPWRRVMNYNTWLAHEGYLVLKGESEDRANLEDLFDQGTFFRNVDWSKTRAYAMGLGNIYINLMGREGQGIVRPGAEYDALVAELKERLPAFVDEETGGYPVAYVFTRDEAYGTYDPLLIPDLFPSNASGYRVGWQDSLGIVAKSVVEPNLDVWSADHCSVYPPLVDGILFSNRGLSTDPKPYMADVMPTLLARFGVEPPTQLDGRSLLPGAAPSRP